MSQDVRVCADLRELSRGAADAAVQTIADAVRRRGKCSLVLSGGSTPRTLYGLLAAPRRDPVPWAHVHVFWGDERYVPSDDPESNYGMAYAALLASVPCPAGNVHPMPTTFSSPDAAARDYERVLRGYFDAGEPRFDLVLLGLGEEGHTASIFPGSPALTDRTRWAIAVRAPLGPPVRLTLTLPVLTRAAHIHVLAAGAKKAGALHQALAERPDPNACPAAGLRATEGTLVWWVDRDALAPAGHGPAIGATVFKREPSACKSE